MTGVKGASWLCCLKSFDLIKGMSPDYMHCACLGVTKLLLNLWTDTARCRGTGHDLHADITLLDERIHQIAVPSEIRHKPRGISDMKHWKGTASIYVCVYILIFISVVFTFHSIGVQVMDTVLCHSSTERNSEG